MDWLKQIAPTIATALGGPLAGMAVSAISKAVGVEPDQVQDMIANNKLSADQIAQVKQKYGGLRYYFESSLPGERKAMDDVVAKYEAVAAVTCEATGNPGVLMKSEGGWVKTLDPEYASSTPHYGTYTVVEQNY